MKYGRDRIGVVIGTSTSGIAEGEKYINDRANAEASSDALKKQYHYRKQEIGAPGLFVANYLEANGPCLTVSTACSSSAKVLATARNWLQMNLCDVVIAGGADSLCRLTINGFHALGLVSGAICKPFQSDRNGINIGEGAALFIVSRDSAPVRLLAVGESSDAYHISAPHPEGEGAMRSMRAALSEARLSPDDIDYINLHGTATPANDLAESRAVAKVFGARTSCSSTKSLTGHTLGAAGAIEAGFCWLLIDAGDSVKSWPAQAAATTLDPQLSPIGLHAAPPAIMAGAQMTLLSNSFAFGGSNVSVVLANEGRKL